MTTAVSETARRPRSDGICRHDIEGFDVDRVPALAEDREKLWAQVSSADFLSDAEKRAMLGLSPMEMSA